MRSVLASTAGAALLLLAGCSSSPSTHPATASSPSPSSPASPSSPSSRSTASSSPSSGHHEVLGPTGYGDLVLGMPLSSARATGQVTGNARTGYRLRDGSHLCFLPGGVLTAITAPANARTPEGIGNGSTEAEVRAAYHPGAHAPDLGWAIPAGPGATYHFFITPDRGVTELTLEAAREDCWR